MNISRVLVTGASGAFGPSVVRTLRDANIDVTALVRRPEAAALFASDVTVVCGDLLDDATAAAAIDGVQGVIHLAAELHRPRVGPDLEATYWRTNVDATRRLIEGAARAGVRRFVLGSTIAVYRPSGATALTEESPEGPTTLYGETKLHAERHVLAATGGGGDALGTILRFAAIYGPGIKGNYQRLVKALARGRFIPIGAGANHRALVYVDDAARAAVAALTNPASGGRIYNVSDGMSHSLAEIIAAISSALGRPAPRLALPVGLVRGGARLVEAAAGALGKTPPVSRHTIDKYLEDVVVSSDRARRELGFVPKTDLLSGWRETIRGMRASGEIPAA